MRWETYYVHLQSGHMLFVDMLCQASASCPVFAATNICEQTYIDRRIDQNRITENEGCLVAPANISDLSISNLPQK